MLGSKRDCYGYGSGNWTFKFYSVMPSSDPSQIQSKSHVPSWEGKETCLPFSSYTKISCHEGVLITLFPSNVTEQKAICHWERSWCPGFCTHTNRGQLSVVEEEETSSCPRYSTNMRSWFPLGRGVGKSRKPDCALDPELSRKHRLPIIEG